MILIFLGKETPIDRNSTRIPNDRFDHTPKKHGEKNVEYDHKNDIRWWLETKQIFKDEDKVIEGNEYNNSCKVRR